MMRSHQIVCVGPSRDASLYSYYFGRCSSELAQRVPLILGAGPLVVLIGCMIVLSPFLDVIEMYMSAVSFPAQLDSAIICLQNVFV